MSYSAVPVKLGRQLTLAGVDQSLRIVQEGLKADQRVIVNGIQRAPAGCQGRGEASRTAPSAGGRPDAARRTETGGSSGAVPAAEKPRPPPTQSAAKSDQSAEQPFTEPAAPAAAPCQSRSERRRRRPLETVPPSSPEAAS